MSTNEMEPELESHNEEQGEEPSSDEALLNLMESLGNEVPKGSAVAQASEGEETWDPEGPPPAASGALETSPDPSITLLRRKKRGSSVPRTVCSACPHALWMHVKKALGPKCFCRLMHRETYVPDEPVELECCDGVVVEPR